MNLHTSMPQLPPPEPKVCVYSGISVPKVIAKNIKYRKDMREQCDKDVKFRSHILEKCKYDPLFWLNTFGFSFSVFKSDTGEAVQSQTSVDAFVTWQKQDEWMQQAFSSLIKGESMLTEKSRDLGVTWLHIFLFAHQFLFYKQRQLLMLSYREEEIDSMI